MDLSKFKFKEKNILESTFSQNDLIYENHPGVISENTLIDFFEAYKRRNPLSVGKNNPTYSADYIYKGKYVANAITRGTSGPRAKLTGILWNNKLLEDNVKRMHYQGIRLYRDSVTGIIYPFIKCAKSGIYLFSNDMQLDHIIGIKESLALGLWGDDIHNVINIQYVDTKLHNTKTQDDKIKLDAYQNNNMVFGTGLVS